MHVLIPFPSVIGGRIKIFDKIIDAVLCYIVKIKIFRIKEIENGIEVVDSALTCSNGCARCEHDDNGDSGDVGFE